MPHCTHIGCSNHAIYEVTKDGSRSLACWYHLKRELESLQSAGAGALVMVRRMERDDG